LDAVLVENLLSNGARVKVIQYKSTSKHWKKYKDNEDFQYIQGEHIQQWGKVLETVVDRVVLISTYSEDAEEREMKIVDQVKKAGVPSIVKLSLIGSDSSDLCALTRMHNKIENYIKETYVSKLVKVNNSNFIFLLAVLILQL